MKFGKEFTTHLEETLPEWRDKFLCYKPLKKFLKNFPAQPAPAAGAGEADLMAAAAPQERGLVDDGTGPAAGAGEARDQVVDLQEWFVRILNEELEKFNEFYVDKEEDFVIRFQELKERIEKVKEKSIKSGLFTSEGEFSEEVMDIRKDFVAIHGEMVLLKNYSSLNFAGLVKILKKYDKRTGGLLRLPFTQLALDQPFFTTEPLTRLVHECEENLELLFPLEAEIIESSSTHQRDRSSATTSNNPPPQDENRAPLGEETMDIYRSTLAAMKTIRGLRKASSTYNPMSLSFLYRNLDDDSSIGALTTENSAANSAANSQNGEELAQADDAPST